jgi:putative membrane protein
MLPVLLMRWLFVAGALALAAAMIPEVEISGGLLGLLGAAALLGLVNALVGPLVRVVSMPITLVTMGLFAFVVNGALLALAAWLSDSLEVGGFAQTVIAAVVISMVGVLAQLMLFGRDPQPA